MPTTVAVRPTTSAVEGMALREMPSIGMEPPLTASSACQLSPSFVTAVTPPVTVTSRHSSLLAIGALLTALGAICLPPATGNGASDAASCGAP